MGRRHSYVEDHAYHTDHQQGKDDGVEDSRRADHEHAVGNGRSGHVDHNNHAQEECGDGILHDEGSNHAGRDDHSSRRMALRHSRHHGGEENESGNDHGVEDEGPQPESLKALELPVEDKMNIAHIDNAANRSSLKVGTI